MKTENNAKEDRPSYAPELSSFAGSKRVSIPEKSYKITMSPQNLADHAFYSL